MAQTDVPSFMHQVDALMYDSKFDEAIQKIEQATFRDENVNLLLANKKSEALIRLGRFDEANIELQNTLTAVSQSKSAIHVGAVTQTTIGFLYLNEGRNDLALDILKTASSTLLQLGRSLETAQALAFLGQVYLSTGKYAQAEEQLQMALAIRNEKLSESHELIAASYNDLGLVYSQLDVDKAIDFYELAAAIYEKLHGKDHPKLAIANTNLGIVYRTLELYGDAILYFESALSIWEKIYPAAHPTKAFVLSNLGQTYLKMNDQEAAMGYYKRALDLYIQSQGKKHPDVATTYNLIGNVLLDQQKYDDALIHYQQAIIANVTDFNSENILVNPSGKNFYNGNVLLYSMMYKAEALEARHFGKTLKQSDLALGLKTLQASDSLIDRLRQQATNESDKIGLGAVANQVYAGGVRIAYILSEVSMRNRNTYREQSFYFAEKSKSAVLHEAISETNAKSFANIPDPLLDEEKRIKSALAMTLQKLAQKPEADEEKTLRENAFTLNQQFQVFIQNLEKKYPEYYNLKFNTQAPSVSQLQQLMGSKSALISYFIDENNNRLYTYLITQNKFKISDQALQDDFNKTISGLRNSVYFLSDQTYVLTARKLYKILIPKVSYTITDLVILPTGRMSVIPFEVLLTKDVKSEDIVYPDLPYLVKDKSVRYEFSAGLLLQKKNGSDKAALLSALLVAPIKFPEKDNLNDLPGTEIEVNALTSLLTENNIQTKKLLYESANKNTLIGDLSSDYSLIHLATHGIVDEENPELSRIFLQSSSDDEDGNLFSGDIYNLKLNAQLVTLSACQTGLGKLSKGEGVIGLSRALVYAGARNIIVSFWNVADESTAELMTDFYRQMIKRRTRSYSENLRVAKINLMKGKYAAPYFWAPFILIGF